MSAPTSTTTAALSSLILTGLLGLAPSLAAQGHEHHKLLPGDGQAGDQFGSAIATDGALVAVGAPMADDLGTASGSAYVFGAQTGAQHFELLPSDGAPGDQFGASITVDGARVVVGAPFADAVGVDSGAAYVFDATTGLQALKLQPTGGAAGDQFGLSVAMDGGRIVVGALGAAYLFDASTGQQLNQLLPAAGSSVGSFGEAVDIDAGIVVVGARLANDVILFSGAAFLFDAASGSQLKKLIPLDGTAWDSFGGSVGIDGGTVVVGARHASPKGKHSGTAYLFDALTGQQTEKFVPSDGGLFAEFGSSVDVDGLYVAIGAEQDNTNGFSSGSVYLFEAQGGAQVVELVASDGEALDDLGGAVAVARGVIVAGATRDDDLGDASGSAYVFDGAGTVTAMSECFGNAGTLDHVGGIAVAGQSLALRMDGAQAGATSALLVGSVAPVPGWPACGVDFGSAGELLIDVTTSSLFLTTTAAWTGSPVDIAVAVPTLSGLVGFPVYFQGAFLAPLSPPEPLRLTHGLEVVFGGYL